MVRPFQLSLVVPIRPIRLGGTRHRTRSLRHGLLGALQRQRSAGRSLPDTETGRTIGPTRSRSVRLFMGAGRRLLQLPHPVGRTQQFQIATIKMAKIGSLFATMFEYHISISLSADERLSERRGSGADKRFPRLTDGEGAACGTQSEIERRNHAVTRAFHRVPPASFGSRPIAVHFHPFSRCGN